MKDKTVRSRSASWCTLAGFLCLLQGCTTVGPDFTAPAVQAPSAWSEWHGGEAVLAADAHSAQELASWDSVLDAPLRELLARALDNNADIRTAALHFAQARTQRAIAAAQAGPQVNARASATRHRLSDSGEATRMTDAIGGANKESLRQFLSSPFTLYDASFDASWELDLWGRVRRINEAADADLIASQATFRQVRLEVQAEVARTYFELRQVRRQLSLARKDVETARESAGLVAARAAGGLEAGLDAVQQRSREAQVAARVPVLERQETALVNALTLLTGERPGTRNALLFEPGRVWSQAPDLALGLPSELAARRPDVQAALARLHAATAHIGVAKADLYPRVTLMGDFGFESLDRARLAAWGSRQWSIGPSLTLPIFDQGRLRGVVELRELQQQEAAVAFQQAVLKAWHEVDAAVSGYQSERRRSGDLAVQMSSAQDARDLALDRYRGGITDFLPVLDAQRTLTQAQSAYSEHEARLQTAWVSLLKALAVPPPDTAGPPRTPSPEHP